MPKYRLVVDAHAMDHILDEDMPDVNKAAHALSTGLQRADWKLHGGRQGPTDVRSPTATRTDARVTAATGARPDSGPTSLVRSLTQRWLP